MTVQGILHRALSFFILVDILTSFILSVMILFSWRTNFSRVSPVFLLSWPEYIVIPMTFETIIRPMVEQDLPQVLALECLCHPRPWSEAMFRSEHANPLSRIDLCWRGGQLAGFICSWRICEEVSILNLATAPDQRRSGVARALLRHVLNRNRQKGLERVLLEVRPSNLAAIALYKSFGFRGIDCRRRYYSDGEDALVMEVLFTDPVNAERGF